MSFCNLLVERPLYSTVGELIK